RNDLYGMVGWSRLIEAAPCASRQAPLEWRDPGWPSGRRRAIPECSHSAAQPGTGDGGIQAAVIFNGTTGGSKIIAPLSVLLPADTLSGGPRLSSPGGPGFALGRNQTPAWFL